MVVHIKTEVIVHLGRLDEAKNVRQPTEFRYEMRDHSDAAFLELAALIRGQRSEVAQTHASGEVVALDG